MAQAATQRKKAQAERRADVVWEGDVPSGTGKVTAASSGAFSDLAISLPTRIGEAGGNTSPEELIAASHAGCYAMALSYALTGAGSPPERLDVSANVGLDPKVGGGFEVSFSHLTVGGSVPGIDQTRFEEIARQAEQACPISNAIRGNVEIVVEATLA
jgi:osmotically inducible protein OsmC